MLLAKKAKAPEGTAGASTASAPIASGAGAKTEESTVSVFGGDEGRKGVSSGPARRKMHPGEIRIQKDIAELAAGKVANVTWPDPSNLCAMKLSITPDSGLWAKATFVFDIKVPDMYPHEPPKVICETKIYHPNIDYEGHVCLNILRDEWKPVYDINTVIYGVISLFYEPNPTDPLNHEAAATMRDNYSTFESNVRSSLRGGRVGTQTFPVLVR